MPKRMQIGVLLAALALSSGGGAWAASPAATAVSAQKQKPAARFTLTEAELTALFPGSVPPYHSGLKESSHAGQKLTGFFNASFRDPQRRAEACEQMPKLGPSDTAARLDRQYRAQMLSNTVISNRPIQNLNASNSTSGFGNDSLNLYLSCLQSPPH